MERPRTSRGRTSPTRLGIRSQSKEELVLADGSRIVRRKGFALFRYQKRIGGADVIFGEPGDSTLLGAFTLEAMGLSLDPLRRELKPLPMILGGVAIKPFSNAVAQTSVCVSDIQIPKMTD